MSAEDKTKKGISRRSFLKGSAIAAVGVASGGLLTACGEKAAEPQPQPDAPAQAEAGAGGKASFEIAPEPIPDSEIKETITTDVVVVGAGFAGMCAAVSAGQEGAKVVLLEKTANMQFRGYDYAAVNSKAQKSVGNVIDPVQVIREIMRFGGYKGDQRVVSQFVNSSGKVNDWLLDMAVELGCKYTVWKAADMVTPTATFPPIPTMTFVLDPPAEALEVMPQGTLPPTAGMAWVLLKNAQKAGVDIRFSTPAVQLIRPGNQGRVTGVIAQQKDGSYLKVNAAKGVVLCAGDYGNDKEMLKKYIPSSEYIKGVYYNGTHLNFSSGSPASFREPGITDLLISSGRSSSSITPPLDTFTA